MKKIIIPILALAIALPFACKKKDDAEPDNSTNSTTTTGGTTGTPVVAGSFTWTENGGPVNTADSAYWVNWSSGTGIRASKGGFANYFEINWGTANNTSVGTKSLSAGDFTFIKGSTTYTNSSTQNLSVTAFSSNKLTGEFTVSVSGGTISTIVGGYTDLINK